MDFIGDFHLTHQRAGCACGERHTGATAIGVMMLVVSFILLLIINLIQRRIEKP